jgi:diguanylate cyclase (GGDEF)-like protein/PAS domain S-box-containing protein
MPGDRQNTMTPLLSLLRISGISLVALALPLLAWLALSNTNALISPDFFLWSHALLELLAVIIAACIFFVGWNILDDKRPRASLLLACAFLSVAMFDTAHLLSYPGMPDFVTENISAKTELFWLVARCIAAISLLVYLLAARMPTGRPLAPARYAYLFTTLALTAMVWLLITSTPAWVGSAGSDESLFLHTPGQVLVLVVHLITLAVIWWQHKRIGLASPAALVMAVLLMTTSGIFFLIPGQSQTLSVFIGHIYKVLAYAYLYRAMFLDTIRAPMERLQQAHATLQTYSDQLDELLSNAPDGIMGIDRTGRIRFVNPALQRLFGYSEHELLGEPVEILLPISLRHRHNQLRDSYLAAPTGRPMASQRGLVGRCKDGHEIPVDIALGTHNGVDGVQITAFIRDVSERQKLERDMQHRATHDMLTGLPNRQLMSDRLDRAIVHSRRHSTMFCLIMVDLDNFKDINDGWGHTLGDQLLITVARRLHRALRQGDTVARFGGDEFVILATDVNDLESAQSVVEKITDAMRNVFVLGEHQFHVSASIGVALFPEHADDAETLLSHADIAMYRAKAMGRRTACFFDPGMSQDQQDTLILKTRLIDALDEGALHVFYQPQYRVSDQRICGFEALLRWSPPDGSISPEVFIPVAEANGLIIPVTEMVLSTACHQIRLWTAIGKPVRVSVNISALHFRQKNALVKYIEEQLAATGIDPTLLGIELTETALMDNTDVVAETLRHLVALGLHVSIDDFGTGYSSLASLQLFPLQTLKIDRSFMRDLTIDPKKSAIISGLVNLADSLELEVMAEGVETTEQYQILLRCRCDSMQGWLMNPALPAAECTRLLQSSPTIVDKDNERQRFGA